MKMTRQKYFRLTGPHHPDENGKIRYLHFRVDLSRGAFDYAHFSHSRANEFHALWPKKSEDTRGGKTRNTQENVKFFHV